MVHPSILKDYSSRRKTYDDLLAFLKKRASVVFYARLTSLDIDINLELEDFCSDFIEQSLRQYRLLGLSERPQVEFLAFVHQHALNRLQTRRGKIRSILWLRSHTWCDRIWRKVHNAEKHQSLAIEQVSVIKEWDSLTIELLDYVATKQPVYRTYLTLELQGCSPLDIEKILGLSKKERASIKDQITRHSKKFANKVRNGIATTGEARKRREPEWSKRLGRY